MALVSNNVNIEYDKTGRFYYLTVLGAKALTGYTLDNIWQNAPMRLKKLGKTLKRYLTMSAYNNSLPKQYRPIDLFEFMVFQNANDEVNYIIDMLVEMVEWAYDTDGDRAVYEDGGGEIVPQTVKDIAQVNNLKISGRTNSFIEDDDWRVGY